jgi:hypothetical protein
MAGSKLEVVGLEDYWAVIDVDGGIVASYYDEQDAVDFVESVKSGEVEL